MVASSDKDFGKDLAQTAIHCYLSTILSATECISKVMPAVGVLYHDRWKRLPQRIAFDASSRALEASEHLFHSDLKRFAELAGQLFGEGLGLVQKLSSDAGESFDKAIQETASYASLLDQLAESLDETADLNASPQISEMLVLQSQGLRKSARQLRSSLLPALNEISSRLLECRKIQLELEQGSIIDPVTGFFNNHGFLYQLKCRFEESRECCVLLIDCAATTDGTHECSEQDFNRISRDLASRLSEQFRPWDCLARIGPRRIGVIFEGSQVVARDRSEQIARSISGSYAHGLTVNASVQVIDASEVDSLMNLVFTVGKTTTPLEIEPPFTAADNAAKDIPAQIPA